MTFCLIYDPASKEMHVAEATAKLPLCNAPLTGGSEDRVIRPVMIPSAVSAEDRGNLCPVCTERALKLGAPPLSPAVIALASGRDPEPSGGSYDKDGYHVAMKAAPAAAFETIDSSSGLESAQALFEKVEQSSSEAYLQEATKWIVSGVRSVSDPCSEQFFTFGVVRESSEYDALSRLRSAVLQDGRAATNFRDWLAETIEAGALIEASERGRDADVSRVRWRLLTETLIENDARFLADYAEALARSPEAARTAGENIFLAGWRAELGDPLPGE